MMSRRGFLLGGGACVLCAGAGYAVGRVDTKPRPSPDRIPLITRTIDQRQSVQPDAIFRVDTDEPIVALSFDDGPDPKYTPTVVEHLEKHGAHATFFLIGVNVLAHHDLLAMHLEKGHDIGNHTYDHPDLELLSPAQIQDEIERASRALVGAGAPKPSFFRPPKGFTDEAVGVLADADRYRTVFWDLGLERFLHHEGERRGVEAVLSRVRPGSIILAHDGGHVAAPNRPWLDRRPTVAALPRLLDGLAAKGYQVVDVATLLTRSGYSLLPAKRGTTGTVTTTARPNATSVGP